MARTALENAFAVSTAAAAVAAAAAASASALLPAAAAAAACGDCAAPVDGATRAPLSTVPTNVGGVSEEGTA